jgi:hypothetical protein
MRTRATSTIIAAVILVALGIYLWHTFVPGPMAFAGGSTVALADYHAADPTGVPAELAGADPIKRGEYLARAADCLVCHTAPGGAPYAGGLAIPLPFGTIYTTKGDRHRQLQRRRFSQCGAAGHTSGRSAALSGHALSVLHFHDRRRWVGDQGLSAEPAGCARGESRRHARLSVQSALVDDFLVAGV